MLCPGDNEGLPVDDKILFYRRPAANCSLCGRSLYGVKRYRVYLIVKNGPLEGTRFKKLHLCENCLAMVKKDPWLKKRFLIRYRRMPVLGKYREASLFY